MSDVTSRRSGTQAELCGQLMAELDGLLERAKNRGFPTGILTFTEQ